MKLYLEWLEIPCIGIYSGLFGSDLVPCIGIYSGLFGSDLVFGNWMHEQYSLSVPVFG
jgi:hypothetical protein